MNRSLDHPGSHPGAIHQKHRRNSASFVEDLLQLHWPRYDEIPKPVHMTAMRGWYRMSYYGDWNAQKMVDELREFLIYSDQEFERVRSKDRIGQRLALFVFKEGDSAVLKRTHTWSIQVWADTPEAAKKRLFALAARYRKKKRIRRSTTAAFKVIQTSGGLSSRVLETKPPIRTDADLALHYNEGFTDWNNNFLDRLTGKTTGLSLFQGPPGTGKTTYLRYLMLKLARTHLFYYVPVSAYRLLAASGAVDFWIEESTKTKGKRVIILEDAEPLVMKRATDNHDCVSNLLNICDGFLGDLLKLHVICTINCAVGDLDPALLRPGRMLAYHEFLRLTEKEAKQLAVVKGKSLAPQADYSLAEIYASSAAAEVGTQRKLVGFGGCDANAQF